MSILARLHTREWSTLGIYHRLSLDEHAGHGHSPLSIKNCLYLKVTIAGTLTTNQKALGVTPWRRLEPTGTSVMYHTVTPVRYMADFTEFSTTTSRELLSQFSTCSG